MPTTSVWSEKIIKKDDVWGFGKTGFWYGVPE